MNTWTISLVALGRRYAPDSTFYCRPVKLRSRAQTKTYFGYEPAEARCRYEPMVVVDRYMAYAFLKELLQLVYCWAHRRRDFLQLRLGGQEDQAWADGWIERIAKLSGFTRAMLAGMRGFAWAQPPPAIKM